MLLGNKKNMLHLMNCKMFSLSECFVTKLIFYIYIYYIINIFVNTDAWSLSTVVRLCTQLCTIQGTISYPYMAVTIV